MEIPKAKFQCRACRHQWQMRPGFVDCPQCRHEFVDWLNWEIIVKTVYERDYDKIAGRWR